MWTTSPILQILVGSLKFSYFGPVWSICSSLSLFFLANWVKFGFRLHLPHQFSICFCSSSFSFCTPRCRICKNASLGKYFREILILKSYESASKIFQMFDKKRSLEKNVSQKYSNWFDSSCQCNLRFHCSKVGCCNLQWVGSIEMHLDEMFLCQNVLNLESRKVEDAVQHYNKEFMKPTLKISHNLISQRLKATSGLLFPKQVSNPTCWLSDHAILILPHSCKIFVAFSPTI